jgi:hypothetical protein
MGRSGELVDHAELLARREHGIEVGSASDESAGDARTRDEPPEAPTVLRYRQTPSAYRCWPALTAGVAFGGTPSHWPLGKSEKSSANHHETPTEPIEP